MLLIQKSNKERDLKKKKKAAKKESFKFRFILFISIELKCMNNIWIVHRMK